MKNIITMKVIPTEVAGIFCFSIILHEIIIVIEPHILIKKYLSKKSNPKW